MLTSWVALLGLMERVVSGARDGKAEADIGQLRELIERLAEGGSRSERSDVAVKRRVRGSQHTKGHLLCRLNRHCLHISRLG